MTGRRIGATLPANAARSLSRGAIGAALARATATLLVMAALACTTTAWAADPTPPPPVSGRDAASEQAILPADVLARVNLLRAELELVRRELGVKSVQRPDFPVVGAKPREVYFQALTLFRKSDRFCFEQVGIVDEPPINPSADSIRPMHVLRLVNKAYIRVMYVKQQLGIPERVTESAQPTSVVPNDVFRSIVHANQTLNQLLSQRTSPADVYQEVTAGIHLAATLLAHFPGVQRIPEPEPLVRRKVPGDVFARLLTVFELLRAIALKSGLEMIEIDANNYGIDATPSDVFDIATLIVSELAYLHSELQGAREPTPSHYAGRKTPSHVYQRVGVLEGQLRTLGVQVDASPNWLR